MSEGRLMSLIDLVADAGTQSRAGIDRATVEEYAAAVRGGEELPDIEAVSDGETAWVWDGFHRLMAYEQAGVKEGWVNIQAGTLAGAQWLACSANRKHGLKRTNDDKRHAAEMALKIRPNLSDRAIAEHCGVSNTFVGDVRREVCTVHTSPPPANGQVSSVDTSRRSETTRDTIVSRTGRDGKQYPVVRPPDSGEGVSQEEGEAVLNGHADAPVSKPIGNTPRNAKAAREALGPPRDGTGAVIPPELRDVFADPALPEAIRRVGEWADAVNARSILHALAPRVKAYTYLRLADAHRRLEEAGDLIDSALEDLKAGLPHAVCPVCAGQGCENCRRCGYVTSWRLEELQREGVA